MAEILVKLEAERLLQEQLAAAVKERESLTAVVSEKSSQALQEAAARAQVCYDVLK